MLGISETNFVSLSNSECDFLSSEFGTTRNKVYLQETLVPFASRRLTHETRLKTTILINWKFFKKIETDIEEGQFPHKIKNQETPSYMY